MLGNIVESAVSERLNLPGSFSRRASQFIRDKTGAGEVYAHFMFPEHLVKETRYLPTYAPVIACIRDIVDDVNDILSFFKESVVGSETNTHIMNRARASCCSPDDVLEQVCRDAAETIHVASDAVAGEEVVQQLLREFVNGYIMWHLCEDRYWIKEVGIVMTEGKD
ncbi:hypothetical protein BDV25DRAFT_155650 [Aspergillus avenaceus]|uniref:Isoprenoid synthase domain-containing protein n=1 Tax=Aspergillus avenaceus TaxID=36643 RepID=A0A5N6TUJ8_ASPAV|nr:hypothetical protein BDV25DRAFT_155650 [Aspergillus avenaceus]